MHAHLRPLNPDSPENDHTEDVAREPSALRSLDPRVITVWKFDALIEGAVALVIGIGIAFAFWSLEFPEWLVVVPVLSATLLATANFIMVPSRRWRSWRYAVDESVIELRHGIWWQTWTRVPMARVQHVDTRQGPIDRRYGVAILVLYTAAGARQIPGLARPDAEAMRDRIAELANLRDDV